MSELSNKVVLVTGASSGIGEATVRELASAGARLFIGARRGERLKALAEELGQELGGELGDTIGWAELDVTDADSFEAFAAAAQDRFGRIDVLVNNAGVMPLSPLAALKRDEWKRMIDVNIHGVLNGIAAVLPGFIARKSGHVVNVASVGAHLVLPTAAVYCGTKYAVWAITEGLRQEHDEIRSTIISPGVTATELGDDISDPQVASALKEWRQKSLTPDAIARAIRYALEQPEGVDINEVIVRPTAANM
ncbi:SDR family oxidoreductase [Novosphingobium guangzhouense]|uniref:Oxidoreductase n=1 Tax=Novosphingobium guangzhouense TaxID=1850347 RepID=A0A2K2FX07_9SPHN|nr:SDR family oxidoreductase [Novosphingobium guangzhouense]PNU03326.1 oxidoreductase [Novosphingobium guangzhouense]